VSTFVLDAEIIQDEEDNEDDDYQGGENSGSDGDLEAFSAEDIALCNGIGYDEEARYLFRKRPFST
jgi:hypothetical protein